jgi:hypothetical protein
MKPDFPLVAAFVCGPHADVTCLGAACSRCGGNDGDGHEADITFPSLSAT